MRDVSAGEVDAKQNREGNKGEVSRAAKPLKTRAFPPAVPVAQKNAADSFSDSSLSHGRAAPRVDTDEAPGRPTSAQHRPASRPGSRARPY